MVTKGTTPKTFGESFTDSGVPFLKAENITGGPVDLEKLMTLSTQQVESPKQKLSNMLELPFMLRNR